MSAQPTAPPHDIELERALLGAILLSEQVLPVVAVDEHLTAEVFHRLFHRDVFAAMLDLHRLGEPVDVITVKAALRQRGATADQAEGVELLCGTVPGLGNVRSYARRVVELAEWRTVQAAGLELAAAAETLSIERRERAEALLAVRERAVSAMLTPEALREVLWTHLQAAEPDSALPTPFAGLAGSLGGFRPGETTLLGGWTSRGKSVIADTVLTFLGRAGFRVHLYINEMTPKMRGLRILSAESGVPLPRLTGRAAMTAEDTAAAVAALERGMPFGITQISGWTAADIARDMRYRKWDLACVDILHLIEHREERDLAAISQTLTAAARITGTHLLATVHLNEERAKQATLPSPVLRDIRGSGMLKNDADNVLFVHREDEVDDRGVAVMTNDAVLYLSKCRNGALGGTKLTFDGRRVRFIEQPAGT